MIVTVANVKGGVSKTTTSLYLAHALKATLVDADSQGSAIGWSEAAQAAGTPLEFPVVSLPTPRLAERLPLARHIVIDTPPGDLKIIRAAVAAADVVLIPTGATALDLIRVWHTLDIARESGTRAVVLLCRVRANTRAPQEAVEALKDENVTVLATRIPLREALAFAYGEPIGADYGYADAAAELLKTGKRQ